MIRDFQKRYSSLKEIITDLSEIMLPPERISVSDAAVKYRRVYNPPAYVGPWDKDLVSYNTEVTDTLESREYSAVCFVAPAQSGKALSLDTPIATPEGWVTMGDLQPGDKVFDEGGNICNVIAVTDPMMGKNCFRITFDDGSDIITDDEHRWYVETKDLGSKVTTTLAMSKDFNFKTSRPNGRSRYAIPNTKPLILPTAELPIDPYVLGLWLGDGSSYRAHITCGDQDIDFCMRQIADAGYRVSKKRERTCWQIYIDYRVDNKDLIQCIRGHNLDVLGRTKRGYCAECARQSSKKHQYDFVMDDVLVENSLYLKLQSEKLLGLGNKHIPLKYLRSSRDQRVALLQGLMDSDGTASSRVSYSSFCTTLPELRDGVSELLSSLGLKHTVREGRSKLHGKDYGPKWDINFTSYPENIEVFRLPRKLQRSMNKINTRPTQTTRRWIRNIEPIDSVPVKCIAVDSSNHLYLAGKQMVPTHNTEILQNWLAYNVTCDPSDFMIVEKSQTEARNFSMMKIDRTIRHSPEIASRMLSASTADNTFDKMFKSGTYLSINWPTVNALSGKTVRRVGMTDYDRWPEDIGGEGSGFDLGRRRTNSYKRLGMTYVESSPSFDVEDFRHTPATPHEAPPCKGILGIYNRGDRRRWYWQCPHCYDRFEPSFSLIRYPPSNDLMECAESAYMACPHCFDTNGAMIESHMKRELNLGGVWLRDGETIDWMGNRSGIPRRSDIASFWLKGPAAAFAQWPTLVINYLNAMQEYDSNGNDRPLKTTYNTDQGEPYIPPSILASRSPEDIMDRAKDIGERLVPFGVRFLIATIDVQKTKFVVQVHGIKPAPNTIDLVVIDRFNIEKSERRDEDNERKLVNPAVHIEDWDLITTQVINRSYPLEDGSGRQMLVKCVACDSGGRAGVTAKAYEFYRRLKPLGLAGRFHLIKGASSKNAPRVQKGFPDSERKDRMAGARGEIPILFLNGNILKDWLNAALDRTEPGGGYIEFADWLPLEFYKELCVEVRNHKGEWENLKKLRNESWDLLCYCYALCIALRAEKINWDKPEQAWAREWDKNALVFSGTADVLNKPKEDINERLKKLAQQVG